MQKSQNCKLIFPKKSLEMFIKRILILIISFWLVQVNHSTDRSCWWFLGWQRVLWYWYRYNIRVLFLVAPSPATRPDQSNWGGSMHFKGVKLAYRPTDNFFRVCTAARSPTFLCLTHKHHKFPATISHCSSFFLARCQDFAFTRARKKVWRRRGCR